MKQKAFDEASCYQLSGFYSFPFLFKWFLHKQMKSLNKLAFSLAKKHEI